MPDLVATRVQVDAVRGEVAAEGAVCVGEGGLEIEVVDAFLFGEGGDVVIEPADAVTGDCREAGRQDGVDKNLGGGMLLAQLLHDLLQVGEDFFVAFAFAQVVDADHDVNGIGAAVGKGGDALQNACGGVTRKPLVEPEPIARQAIAGKPEGVGIPQNHGEAVGALSGCHHFGLLFEQLFPLGVGGLEDGVLPFAAEAVAVEAGVH